jgi:hypothetical protein
MKSLLTVRAIYRNLVSMSYRLTVNSYTSQYCDVKIGCEVQFNVTQHLNDFLNKSIKIYIQANTYSVCIFSTFLDI